MKFIDGVLNGLGLEPIHNLSFLSQKLLETSNSASVPDAEPFHILLALFKNNLETYQISQDAGTDKLTDTLNRKYLDLALEKAFARSRRTGEDLAVIICDLDFFKNVNDVYGHLKGDEVLKEAARVISETIRGYGMLGRYGGEEFMAVLPNCSEGQAAVLAERIRAAVQAADILKGKREITLSLGAAVFPYCANTAATLVEKADKALYIAKKSGRNRFVIWRENFSGEASAKDITSEMLTGDAAKDAGRIKALVDITEILNSAEQRGNRLERALDKIIDTVGAEAITFFTLEDMKITGSHSVARRDRKTKLNWELLNRVLKLGDAVFQVDWDNEIKEDHGFSDWNSLAIAPAINDGVMKGIAYVSVSVKEKELSPDEAGFICNAAALLAAAV